VDVPCGDCSACCHDIAPFEMREDGSCINLLDGKCSIYETRPNACRAFDCRTYFFCEVEPETERLQDAVKRWYTEDKTGEDKTIRLDLTATARHMPTSPMMKVGYAVGRHDPKQRRHI
jgi:hypothetical protein